MHSSILDSPFNELIIQASWELQRSLQWSARVQVRADLAQWHIILYALTYLLDKCISETACEILCMRFDITVFTFALNVSRLC